MNKQSKKARENRDLYRNLNEKDVFKINNSILQSYKSEKSNKQLRNKSSVNAFGVKNQKAYGILSKSLNRNILITEQSAVESSTFSKFKSQNSKN